MCDCNPFSNPSGSSDEVERDLHPPLCCSTLRLGNGPIEKSISCSQSKLFCCNQSYFVPSNNIKIKCCTGLSLMLNNANNNEDCKSLEQQRKFYLIKRLSLYFSFLIVNDVFEYYVRNINFLILHLSCI